MLTQFLVNSISLKPHLLLLVLVSLTAAAVAEDPYVVVHGWPRLPDGFALGQVSGVSVDSHDHVFVFHRGIHPILCFDGASGKILVSWGDGMFGTPHGLKVDHQDNVWVTDVGHHQVFKFTHDGELLMTVGARDVPGLDGKHFNKPTDLALDVDGDGQVDVVSGSWYSHKLAWWKNPGRGRGMWKEQVIEDKSPVEFAFLVDLDNDGQALEILPEFGDEAMPLAWYEFKGGSWLKHVISNHSYGHGIGAGDVNGDGRTDIITPQGWFEAPPDPRTGEWKWHPDFDLGATGFIHVLDVNGDGRNDLVTSLAHDYGIFWMEQGEGNRWTKHLIDDSWSQAHALALVDLNGDGQRDLLTGKRYMAHNGHDPGEREPLGIYWYEYRKDDAGQIVWIRHVIDYSTRAGGGMQIALGDVDGDGAVDFAVGGKSGLFLFHNLSKRSP